MKEITRERLLAFALGGVFTCGLILLYGGIREESWMLIPAILFIFFVIFIIYREWLK